MRIRPHKLIIKNTDKKRQAKDISRENSVELEQELLDDIKAALGIKITDWSLFQILLINYAAITFF